LIPALSVSSVTIVRRRRCRSGMGHSSTKAR
jgi:hypothetical protein